MKLYHQVFSKPIEIKENIINVIVIENARVFAGLIFELKKQIEGLEGDFVFSHNDELLDISKSLDLITDLFNINMNSKKIVNKLYEKLSILSVSEDFYLKTVEVKSIIEEYIESLSFHFNQSICYNSEIDTKAILKMLEVKLYDNYNSVSDIIINYMDIMRDYCKINTFVFINLKTFLSEDEIKEFYLHVAYNKINIILLENRISKREERIESYTIIDEDLCSI